MADREQHNRSERREPPEQPPTGVWGPVEGRECGLYDPDSDDQEEDAPIDDSA